MSTSGFAAFSGRRSGGACAVAGWKRAAGGPPVVADDRERGRNHTDFKATPDLASAETVSHRPR